MSESAANISINRNVAFWSVVAGLVVLGFGIYYFLFVKIPKPSPDDIVMAKLNPQPVNVPREFQETLATLHVTGLALVDEDQVLQVITPTGAPIDLCDSEPEKRKYGDPACKLTTKSRTLVSQISNASDSCGYCTSSSGATKRCHIASQRYPCRMRYDGHLCVDSCQ